MARLSRDSFPGLIPLGGSAELYLQVGKGTFSGVYTDSTDMPLRTQLTHVDFGVVSVAETYSPATDATMTQYSVFSDYAVSSGAITLFRSSQAAVSGLPFKYVLIGRVEATD